MILSNNIVQYLDLLLTAREPVALNVWGYIVLKNLLKRHTTHTYERIDMSRHRQLYARLTVLNRELFKYILSLVLHPAHLLLCLTEFIGMYVTLCWSWSLESFEASLVSYD